MTFKSSLHFFSKHTLLLIIFFLATSFAWAQQRNRVLDGIIVKVNNQIILRSDLQTAVAQAEAQAQT